MIVTYPTCTIANGISSQWSTGSEEMCGPFKGEFPVSMCPVSSVQCAGVKVVVTSPECFDPLAISDDCGVSASSALDEDTLPGNVIEEDETYWAPAIRSACRLCHPVISHCCDTVLV